MKTPRTLAALALLLVWWAPCAPIPSQDDGDKPDADAADAEFPPLPLKPHISIRGRHSWKPALPQGRTFLDQPLDVVGDAFSAKGVYVGTPDIQLFYAGGSMKLGPKTYDRVRESVQAIAEVYPQLKRRYPVLKRQHVAHLVMYHMHRVMQETWRVFGTNKRVYNAYYGGPRMRMKGGFEGALFKSVNDHLRFCDRFTGNRFEDGERTRSPNSDTLGFVLPTPPGGSKEPSRMINNVVNTMTQNYIMAEITNSYRVPIWLVMGFAHWFEAREGTDYHTYWFDEGGPPEDFATGDWRSKIRQRVLARDVPQFEEFMAYQTFGECKSVHRGVSYGLIDYMLREHLEGFRAFVALRRDDPRSNTEQRDDFKKAFGMSPTVFYEKWKMWVRENYSKTAILAMPKAEELFTGQPVKEKKKKP